MLVHVRDGSAGCIHCEKKIVTAILHRPQPRACAADVMKVMHNLHLMRMHDEAMGWSRISSLANLAFPAMRLLPVAEGSSLYRCKTPSHLSFGCNDQHLVRSWRPYDGHPATLTRALVSPKRHCVFLGFGGIAHPLPKERSDMYVFYLLRDLPRGILPMA